MGRDTTREKLVVGTLGDRYQTTTILKPKRQADPHESLKSAGD
jgi:hypothetical protein